MASVNSGNLGGDLKGLLPMPLVIGLTDQVGRRRPIKELLEGLYLFVEGGKIVTKPASGGGVPLDGPSLLIPPPDSYAGSAGDDLTKYSQQNHSHLLNISPTALPLPNGTPAVGSGRTYADIFHIHPLTPSPPPPPGSPADPVVATSTLYTAKVGASLSRGEVYCPFKSSEVLFPCHIPDPTLALVQADFVYNGDYSCLGRIFPGWNELSPGVWQDSGAAEGSGGTFASQCDDHTPTDGEFFIAYNFTPDPGDIRKQQIYQVVDCGIHVVGGSTVYSKVTVQRAADYQDGSAYVADLHLLVRNGLLYAGKWFHLLTAQPITLDTTDLYWEVLSSYTPTAAKEELLSAAQMVSEGANSRTVAADSPAWSSFEPAGLQIGPTFSSKPLGVTSIPAGTFRARLFLRNSVAGATSFAEVRWWVKHVDGTIDAPFLTMTSGPVTATYNDFFEVTGTLAAPVTTVSTDIVQNGVFAHGSNDPSTGVVLYWTFQEPTRTSHFTVTWQPDGVVALFAGWTEILPGVMQKNDTGPLSSVLFDGVLVDVYNPSGIPSLIGKTVFAFDVAIDDASKKLTGPWIVDDVGGHVVGHGTPEYAFVQTHARMHRAPDYSYSSAFVHGMTFQCDNGDTYGGGYFTLNSSSVVLGTTVMDWSWTAGTPAPSDEKYEALTGPQLTSEGALTTTLEFSATTSAPSTPAPMPYGFVTLVGTPGVAALAAGPYRFDVEAVRVSGGDTGSATFLRGRVLDHATGAELLSFDSAPFSNAANAPLSWIGVNASPVTTAPDRQLSVVYAIITNSVTPVTVIMRYNSSSRGTKLTMPFAMAISGASDGVHDHLSGRNTVNNHFGVGTCTTASGIVPVPTKTTMVVTISGNPFLSGMHMEGLESGVPVELTFLQDCHLLEEAGTLAAGVARFLSSHLDGSAPDQIDIAAGGRVGLRFFATELPQSPCFQLTWGPVS